MNQSKTGFIGVSIILLLIISISISTASAQDLSQLRIIDRPELSQDGFVGSEIKDANGRICAGIMVISDMEDFSYQSNNGVVKVSSSPGQDIVYVSPDERLVEVYHSGYEPLKIILSEYGVNLESKRIWRFKITGDKAELGYGDLIIETDPPGFEIIHNGSKLADKTPVNLVNQLAGNHKVLIKGGKDYLDVDTTITIQKDKEFIFNTTMILSYGELKIATDPPGAKIYIDEKFIGKEPIRDKHLGIGKHSISIVKDLYHKSITDVVIYSGITLDTVIALDANFGALKISTKPDGMNVYLSDNNRLLGVTPFEVNLVKGKHPILIQHSLYETISDTISIEIGERNEISKAMNRKKGNVLITTNPAGAQIYFDGKKVGISPQTITDYPTGTYSIKAQLDGYMPANESVVIEYGENREKDINLDEGGRLKITTNPSSSDILVDGVSVQNKKLGIQSKGKHKIEVSATGYRTKITNVNITAGKVKEINISLKSNATIEKEKKRLIMKGIYIGAAIPEWGNNRFKQLFKPLSYELGGQITQFFDISIGKLSRVDSKWEEGFYADGNYWIPVRSSPDSSGSTSPRISAFYWNINLNYPIMFSSNALMFITAGFRQYQFQMHFTSDGVNEVYTVVASNTAVVGTGLRLYVGFFGIQAKYEYLALGDFNKTSVVRLDFIIDFTTMD